MIRAARAWMTEEARLLMAEYDRAGEVLGSSTKVAAALELTPDRHYEIAAWGDAGAQRVVEALREAEMPPREAAE